MDVNMNVEIKPESVEFHQISVEYLDALKGVMLNNSSGSKKNVIHILIEMLNTYDNESQCSEAIDLPDLPKILMQVDIIHAISQVMATSDVQLFRCTLRLLNLIYQIPTLRKKLGIAMESGLRVASMVVKSDYSVIAKARKFFLTVLEDLESVPLSIQRQVMAVYRRLPESLEPKHLLEWTQLILHCPSLLDSLPLKVYFDFVKVLIAHQHVDKIGCRYLTFLANSFKKMSLHSDICINNNDFLKLLNELISHPCRENITEDVFIQICCSFEIVHRYIIAVDASKEKISGVYIIKWNLTKCIPCLTQYGVSDVILILLTELLRKDLKSDVLLIVEEDDTKMFDDLLSTFHFMTLGLVHKAILLRSQIIIWIFLYELFRFCARRSEQALGCFHPELSNWNLITFSAILPPDQELLSLPVEFWKFVLEWVKLLSRQDETLFKIPEIDYQSFNFGSFVWTLHKRIRSENFSSSNDTVDPGFHCLFEESQNNPLTCTITKEKEDLLVQIRDLCWKMTDASMDWDAESNTTGLPSICGDLDGSLTDFDEFQEEEGESHNFTFQSGSGSETCSESDLQIPG